MITHLDYRTRSLLAVCAAQSRSSATHGGAGGVDVMMFSWDEPARQELYTREFGLQFHPPPLIL